MDLQVSSGQTNMQNFERDWVAYYQAVEGRPPRDTLLAALAQFNAEPLAKPRFSVDLGCGDGRDTVELLRQGWRVLAIDGEQAAIDRLVARPDVNFGPLETRLDQFETLTLPESVDLINASFSLPFCHPDQFPELWVKIVAALRLGGRFCGQLIGDRDSWAAYPRINSHRRDQIEALLHPFVVEQLTEEEHPGKTALGEEKYWHLFHIVACKQARPPWV